MLEIYSRKRRRQPLWKLILGGVGLGLVLLGILLLWWNPWYQPLKSGWHQQALWLLETKPGLWSGAQSNFLLELKDRVQSDAITELLALAPANNNEIGLTALLDVDQNRIYYYLLYPYSPTLATSLSENLQYFIVQGNTIIHSVDESALFYWQQTYQPSEDFHSYQWYKWQYQLNFRKQLATGWINVDKISQIKGTLPQQDWLSLLDSEFLKTDKEANNKYYYSLGLTGSGWLKTNLKLASVKNNWWYLIKQWLPWQYKYEVYANNHKPQWYLQSNGKLLSLVPGLVDSWRDMFTYLEQPLAVSWLDQAVKVVLTGNFIQIQWLQPVESANWPAWQEDFKLWLAWRHLRPQTVVLPDETSLVEYKIKPEEVIVEPISNEVTRFYYKEAPSDSWYLSNGLNTMASNDYQAFQAAALVNVKVPCLPGAEVLMYQEDQAWLIGTEPIPGYIELCVQ